MNDQDPKSAGPLDEPAPGDTPSPPADPEPSPPVSDPEPAPVPVGSGGAPAPVAAASWTPVARLDVPPAAQDKPPSTAAPPWLPFVAPALIVLLAVAGFGWWLFAYSPTSAATQNRIAEIGSQLDSLRQELGSNAKSVQEEITRLQKTDQTVQSLQEAHGISIEKLALLASQDSEDLIFAEINYLLGIAQQRLSFERDVPTAIRAMEAADQRLSNLIRPDLEKVRAVLSADLNDLRAVPVADLTGPALYLADVSSRIESLPFQGGFLRPPAEDAAQGGEQPPEPRSTVSSLDEFVLRVWSDLKGLVSIKPLGAEDARIFDPNFEKLIEQQLALEIGNARLELSRRDGAAFKATLGVLAGLLGRYYDREDRSVAGILEELAKMQSLELSPPIPDVAKSIKAVREYVLDRRKLGQPAAPPAQDTGAAPDETGAGSPSVPPDTPAPSPPPAPSGEPAPPPAEPPDPAP